MFSEHIPKRESEIENLHERIDWRPSYFNNDTLMLNLTDGVSMIVDNKGTIWGLAIQQTTPEPTCLVCLPQIMPTGDGTFDINVIISIGNTDDPIFDEADIRLFYTSGWHISSLFDNETGNIVPFTLSDSSGKRMDVSSMINMMTNEEFEQFGDELINMLPDSPSLSSPPRWSISSQHEPRCHEPSEEYIEKLLNESF